MINVGCDETFDLGLGKSKSELLVHACRLGRSRLNHTSPPSVEPIVAEHQRLWLARNRPGGLADSVRRLTS